MAPRPKPAELKIFEGNPGKRDIPKPPNFPRASVRAPVGLSREERSIWRQIAPLLAAAGVLAKTDRLALADLCRCWVRLDKAEADIAKRGLLVMGERGMVKNPSAQAAREYRAAVMRWCAEFGLTPSSRTRLATGEQPKDDLDALLD